MISLCCPSRGRPELYRRMAASALETCHDPSLLELILVVEADDPQIGGYPEDAWILTERQNVVGWNKAAQKAQGAILMQCGDDLIFRTAGWDTLVREAFESGPDDRILLVHGNDGVHDATFSAHPFVSREWYEALGYLTPPWFFSDFTDVWLNELANRLGRRLYLRDLFIEHMHPVVSKRAFDPTDARRAHEHSRQQPQELYERLEAERAADTLKLQLAAVCVVENLSRGGREATG